MTTRFTLTITTSSADGETRRAECTEIAELLHVAAQQVQAGHVTSGAVKNRNGSPTLTWVYTPTAAS